MQRVNHEAFQHKIIEAVWYIMANQGPEAVTMRSVAAKAEVSVGRIQQYFETKKVLLDTSRLRLIAQYYFNVEKYVNGDNTFTALFKLLTRNFPQTRMQRVKLGAWYTSITKVANDPLRCATLQSGRRMERLVVIQLLQEVLDSSRSVRQVDVDAVADELLARAEGLALRVFLDDLGIQDALQIIDQDLHYLCQTRIENK